MTIYSYSKLKCFEQCPQKFKFQYIDKIRTEFKESVELFLGKRVHETLNKLYRDPWYQKEITLEDLLFFLNNRWTKNWNDSITIVKEEYRQKDYLKMAEKYITDYYNRYKPFYHERTISLEERVLINLDGSCKYKLCSYIDRLTEAENGCCTIHDYKTCSRLPSLEDIKKDRQLALYAIGVKERYPDTMGIRLILHFLKFDKEIDSTRTDGELEELRQNTIQLIDTIENTKKFPANPSRLCEWCKFKSICRRCSK